MLRRLAALFSGGKDSTYAIYCTEKIGYNVDLLLTIYPSSSKSLYFHYPNVKLTRLQAEAMRKKHIAKEAFSNELEALRDLIKRISHDIDGVVLGVSSSSFQKKAVESICREYGVEVFTPLWGVEPSKLLREIIKSNFQVMVTGVAALGLTMEWLGKILTEEDVEKLEEVSKKYGVNVCGEGGEMETIVLDCPLFKEKIQVLDYEVDWRGDRGFLIIRKAELRRKTNSL
ncbi:MAG: diphthine--ammonia ligase [Thaumarchaeota archaeon]|nr:diphthine--ammonia ligase [Candidatus Geocrenenecus arthurdayi]